MVNTVLVQGVPINGDDDDDHKKALALMRQGSALAVSLAILVNAPGLQGNLPFCDKKFMLTTLEFIGKGFRVSTTLIINGTSIEDVMIIRLRVGQQHQLATTTISNRTQVGFKSTFKCALYFLTMFNISILTFNCIMNH